MGRAARRIFLLFPLLVVVLLLALYFALDAWLESAGGRRAVERVLTAQMGMPIGLQGDFNIVLLPAVGVSGTDLVIRDGATGEQMARGGQFRVSLELLPLVREELRVSEVVVEDLVIAAQGGEGKGFMVHEVSVTGFAAGETAEFNINLGAWGEVNGEFTWFPQRAAVDLGMEWGGFLFPRISLDALIEYSPNVIYFSRLDANLDGAGLTGTGCFVHLPASALNLEIAAKSLDLNRLGGWPEGEAGSRAGLPFELNLELTADEVTWADTTAFGSVMRLGASPSCP